MNFLKQNALLFVVFITGACVLVLEVVAVRILSPFFGNTIYSYSSILSVILGALSFGYYFGGKYADKNPEFEKFYRIILYSGFTVIILQFLSVFVIPGFAYNLSFTSGPLIISTILFALPSFLLGTLSPYAIKLQEVSRPKEGLGSLTGQIFFFSTMGSIVGSLITGFYLIPSFGVQTIVLGTGFVLIALGILGLLQNNVKKKFLVISISLALLVTAFIQSVTSSLAQGIVYSEEGVYEHLSVYDIQMRGKNARLLMQDRSASSAIDKNTGRLVFEYAPYYQLFRLQKKAPERALFIGAGAYTFPKVMLEDVPDVSIDVAEIEPKLYEIAKAYFGLPETNRLKNYIEDGRRFLHDTSTQYDYIYSDVYKTVYSMPVHLTTKEYFELAKSKLAPNGIFIANIIGTIKDEEQSIVLSELKTFRNVFSNSYFFAVTSPNSNDQQNFIFLGVNGGEALDLKSQQIIDEIENRPIDLESQHIDLSRYDFSKHIIFTDNYAPVDQYSSKLLVQSFELRKSVPNSENEIIQRIKQQVGFGPRIPETEGHAKMNVWLEQELQAISQEHTIKQSWTQKGIKGNYDLTNHIVRIHPENEKRIVIGTHYDTLRKSDDTGDPIPGANNGASGTAVLLEVAKELQEKSRELNVGIDIVFFDAEEGDPDIPPGSSSAWTPWGSLYFGQHLNELYPKTKPDHAVILDVVCSSDAKFYYEVYSLNSAPNQTKKFWEVGASIDSNVFKKEPNYGVLDDHTVLHRFGIPGFLVIDFDYPHLHKTTDTIDKCNGETLNKVKSTLLQYVYSL